MGRVEYTIPEGVLELSVVKRINGDLCDNVGERDNHEGEKQQDQSVDEGVQSQSEENHKAHTSNHCTDFDVFPVDDVENCVVCVCWEDIVINISILCNHHSSFSTHTHTHTKYI